MGQFEDPHATMRSTGGPQGSRARRWGGGVAHGGGGGGGGVGSADLGVPGTRGGLPGGAGLGSQQHAHAKELARMRGEYDHLAQYAKRLEVELNALQARHPGGAGAAAAATPPPRTSRPRTTTSRSSGS